MATGTMFSNLFDLVESRLVEASSTKWWGPVIGSDETADNLSGSFEVSLVQDETGDGTESDARLKSDIEKVGSTAYGLPLYHFCYTGRPERYEGVMAQDVLDVMPSAVLEGPEGYYRVNYRELGLAMRQIG
jgi:hypothetical protein